MRQMRVVNRLADCELEEIQSWQYKTTNGSDDLVWRDSQEHILCQVDSRLVCRVGILEHSVLTPDGALVVGGIGRVVTKPCCRNLGHATATMRFAAEFLRAQRGLSFGILFCVPELIPFYTRLGWSVIPDVVIIRQPLGTVRCPVATMCLGFDDLDWPAGPLDLGSEPW